MQMTDWMKPEDAVTPANPFHPLYMISTGVSEALLEGVEVAISSDLNSRDSMALAELVGTLAQFANWTAALTKRLEEIRVNCPVAYQLWLRAWEQGRSRSDRG